MRESGNGGWKMEAGLVKRLIQCGVQLSAARQVYYELIVKGVSLFRWTRQLCL